MREDDSWNDTTRAARSSQAGTAHGPVNARASRSDGSRVVTTPATVALAVSLTALALGGCVRYSGPMDEPVPEPEFKPADVLLVSDILRFYLDEEGGMDRGIADCYEGVCIQTDGERTVYSLPEFYVFAGHHHEDITAHEDTIEDRNGIMLGDVSLDDLPDWPRFAIHRSITGYGGWGEYVGFDALYYDYVRNERPQRAVEASFGGFQPSAGNPRGETLTWTGGAVGVDYSAITEDRVLVGDAEVTVYPYEELEEYLGEEFPLITVDITNMEDVATGATYEDMTWKHMALREGGFETFEIQGRFFGPDHEEVGGVFDRNQIIGAFGASRAE